MQRVGFAVLGTATAALLLFLSSHHPLSPAVAVMGGAAIAVASFAAPAMWPLWLLATLPIAGLMTWTGWVLVEEFDLVLLACVTGASLRRAIGVAGPVQSAAIAGAGEYQASPSALRIVVVMALGMAFAASTAISLWRGFDAGGGWTALANVPSEAWWWHGYREALNSLRVAKPVLAMIVLFPLWLALMRSGDAQREAALGAFRMGMVLLLLLVGLLALWERWAYTDLTDFSSDYRTTAGFWETHVGGAALDISLALSMPFAVQTLVHSKRGVAWTLAALALVLGSHAAITSFSRILYLAVPVGVALTLLLTWRQRAAGIAHAEQSAQHILGLAARSAAWPALWCVIATVGAVGLFPLGGWRGLLAWLGVLLMAIACAKIGRRFTARELVIAAVAAMLMALAEQIVAAVLPKGAYLAYGGVAVIGATMVLLAARGSSSAAVALLACVAAGAWGMVLVHAHWGGAPAGHRAWPFAVAACLLGVLGPKAASLAAITVSWRGVLATGGASAVAMFLVGTFYGGAYMGGRLQGAGDDWNARLQHWAGSMRLVDGTAGHVFGKGLGRYVPEHLFTGVPEDATGDMRWIPGPGSPRLMLSSGRYSLSWGDLLRLSQRVEPPMGKVSAKVRLRTDSKFELHAEVCEKHLLYNGVCQIGKASQVPRPDQMGQWQDFTIRLEGGQPSRGDWFAPRLIVFSIALESSASQIEIESVELRDATGRSLLLNSDFGRGLAHWYLSSDRHHLPWHMKNMALHLLFEQGWLGLLTGGALLAAAMSNVLLRRASRHSMAPVLAGSLMGVLTVGMVDSVLDIPRVALALWFVTVVALLLPDGSERVGRT